MSAEYTVFVMLAGIVFGVALLAVIIQWLKADDISAAVEEGLARHVLERPHVVLPPIFPGTLARVLPEAVTEAPVRDQSKPGLIGDDEVALGRLCFGWGAGGTVIGLVAGALYSGFVGALLGSVISSAVAIGVVVVVVLVRDQLTLNMWRASHATR
ncbi:MAG: hypothetical protein WCJ30_06210 [Deltaproteobacteria bacterium]